MPILKDHSDDFLAAIENSLKDTARNPRVRAAVRRNLGKIMEDPELQAVLGNLFREVIVDNPRLHEALERSWRGRQAQAAFQLAAERFEPAVRQIGEEAIDRVVRPPLLLGPAATVEPEVVARALVWIAQQVVCVTKLDPRPILVPLFERGPAIRGLDLLR